jgi:uncharacterized repeat protein (TIGR02543 family)
MYLFTGWNTAANGTGTNYNPGDSITVTDNVTLYAQWLNYIDIFKAQLTALSAGSAASPSTVTLASATFTNAATVPANMIAWGEIDDAVRAVPRYVNLDLSNITFDGNAIVGENPPVANHMNIIDDNTYIKGIILPASLRTMGRYSFLYCRDLTRIDVPSGVTSFGEGVFHTCQGLTNIDIPPGITTLTDSLFAYCTGLTNINIPTNITSLAAWALYNTGLTSVSIPNSVTTIRSRAFEQCANLREVTFTRNDLSIETITFPGAGNVGSDTLKNLYLSAGGGAGSYVRTPGQDNWTKFAMGGTGLAGGLIFYDKGYYSDNWRYLEAAPAATEVKLPWGAYGTNIAGTGTGIGTGKANTALIVAALAGLGETGKAAQYCDSLISGGYDDWFFPSQDELDLMHDNLNVSGLGDFGLIGYDYWSSSNYDANTATYEYFVSGNLKVDADKTLQLCVRAIRAF